MKPVIILDGHVKSALSAVRTLGSLGVPLTVGTDRRVGMAAYSKYVTTRFHYASPHTDQDTFIEHLLKQIQSFDEKPVMYTFSDATTCTVERHRSLLEEVAIVLLPSKKSFEIAFDKQKTTVFARSLDIATIPEVQAHSRTFPLVLKPANSVSWASGVGISGTAEVVFTQAQFEEVRTKVRTSTGVDPLMQSFIEGEEYGVEMVCYEGRVLQSFAHKRIRSLSPRGGAAVVKETAARSVHVDRMHEVASTLATNLSWTGPMMVEFKYDEKNNIPYLMEINGRWWGSLPLAEAAGAGFAECFYDCARGTSYWTPNAIEVVRTQHFLGDVKWLLSVLFKQDSLRYRLYPTRLRALWLFFHSTLSDKGDVWRYADPLPALMEIIGIVKK